MSEYYPMAHLKGMLLQHLILQKFESIRAYCEEVGLTPHQYQNFANALNGKRALGDQLFEETLSNLGVDFGRVKLTVEP